MMKLLVPFTLCFSLAISCSDNESTKEKDAAPSTIDSSPSTLHALSMTLNGYGMTHNGDTIYASLYEEDESEPTQMSNLTIISGGGGGGGGGNGGDPTDNTFVLMRVSKKEKPTTFIFTTMLMATALVRSPITVGKIEVPRASSDIELTHQHSDEYGSNCVNQRP